MAALGERSERSTDDPSARRQEAHPWLGSPHADLCRAILAAGVRRDADVLDVFQVVQDHFADLDLAGFEIPARTDLPRQVDFGGDDE